MKLTEIYESFKEKYNDYVVFIKSGNFYLTYGNDALIANYILGYKNVNGKVGFPLSSKEKVIKVLGEKEVSYVIENDVHDVLNNLYYKYLKDANEFKMAENMTNTLINRIKNKISEDFGNYEKIRKFIDEL